MWINYFKVAFRNIARQKFYAFVNVFGLTIGLASTILISLYITDELSYDRFHKDADRIYQVGVFGRLAGQEFNGASSPAPMAATIVDEIPDVEAAIRLNQWSKVICGYGDKSFTEERVLLADSNFFSFFTFKLLQGNPEEALKGPKKLVLSESAAKKYFGYSGPGDESPIGKLMTFGSWTCEVTGIAADPPSNSHFHYTMILSMDSWDYSKNNQWTSNSWHTYFRSIPNATMSGLEEKFDELVDKYVGPEVKQFLNITMDEFREQGGAYHYVLEPMTDIHLKSTLEDNFEAGGRMDYLYIFGSIALFIILIACINFMNLTTARSSNRAKEVGIRKTIGAVRARLMSQFFSESILFALISIGLAILLIWAILPSFNTLAGKQITLGFLLNPWAIISILTLVLLVGLGAGIYPAFYLTSFRPAEVLKGRVRAGFKSSGIRSVLVVLQFSISIGLIVSTLIVYQQLNHLQTQNLGFEKENVLVIDNTSKLGTNKEVFKNRLAGNDGIKSVSYSNMTPPHIDNNSVFRPLVENGEDNLFFFYFVDETYDKTLDLKMVQGRFFDKNIASDSNAVILNEAAMKQLGWTDYQDKRLLSFYDSDDGRPIHVIGVVKDFNFETLRRQVRPMLLLYRPQSNMISIRLKPGDVRSKLDFIGDQWKELTNGAPFDYVFLDQEFDMLFRAEQRMGSIFLVFTFLAILIACLGLFGLASFTAEQRAKEISIRKVMGATVPQVMVMLSTSFTRLVIIAFLVGTPIAYYGMHRWLEGFAYRIDIGFVSLLAGGIAALLISWFTISFQAFKAARANPVGSLRSE